ncbi:MAG: nitrilase-related carbon-nitrogen hydrolase, partial [Bacteroidota bacterium]
MKIALAQLNYHVGDFGFNVSRICETIEKAKSQGAGLVVFAELSVCGYPPRDFLEFNDFIKRCDEAVTAIAGQCQGIAAIVGAPSVNPALKGKPLYNTAFFLADGKVLAKVHKTLLPNYDVFDEYRYFEPNRLPPAIVEYDGLRFALTICEDLWNIADDPLYVRNPVDELIPLAPDILVNIAASPFNYNQAAIRHEVLSRSALTYDLPVIYVNQVGGQTELIFDGGSMVLDRTGKTLAKLKEFGEDIVLVDIQNAKCKMQSAKSGPPAFLHSCIPAFPDSMVTEGTSLLIHNALVMGIRDYFGKMGFSKAILGLSGGIDSAVTLVLAARALGSENVRAILLPSRFSSDHSITDARELAETLGVPYDTIPIEDACKSIGNTLHPQFARLPFNIAEE